MAKKVTLRSTVKTVTVNASPKAVHVLTMAKAKETRHHVRVDVNPDGTWSGEGFNGSIYIPKDLWKAGLTLTIVAKG